MPPTLPYLPIRVDCVLPSTSLRARDGSMLVLPGWRMNLVCCKNDTLYVVAPEETTSVYAFRIHRGGPHALSLHFDSFADVGPNRHINNLLCFDAANDKTFLLATGGDPREQETNGTLTILELPHPSSFPSNVFPYPRLPTEASTIALPCKSTWGIDALPGTNLIAVSSNSHVVLLYELCSSDVPEIVHCLRPISTLNGHFNNIPTIAFSPVSQNRKLLLSGSIDTSFCIYDIERGGRRLYQDKQAASQIYDFFTAQSSCWSVCWLIPDAIKPVHDSDPLWFSITYPRCPLQTKWLDIPLLHDIRSRTCPNGDHTVRFRPVPSLPVYSDDDLAPDHTPGPYYEPSSTDPLSYSSCHLAETGQTHDFDSSSNSSRDNNSVLKPPPVTSYAGNPKMSPGDSELDYMRDSNDSTTNRVYIDCLDPELEDRHFVVGRQDELFLYRLGKNGSGDCCVEELQRIKPIKEENGTISARGMLRLAHVIQVPKLSALIVAQQGGRVALVRLLRSTRCNRAHSRDSSRPGVFMMMEQLIGVDKGPIAGMCINLRDSDCCELFVVRTQGTCECYELSRRKEAGLQVVSLIA